MSQTNTKKTASKTQTQVKDVHQEIFQATQSSIKLVITAFIYIMLGISLCYFKIVLNDFVKDSDMDYYKFMGGKKPTTGIKQMAKNALSLFIDKVVGSKNDSSDSSASSSTPLKTTSTIPSIFYYSNEGKAEYCKQIFVSNSDFIHEYAKTYSSSEINQIFKTFFLDNSYIFCSVIGALEGIPDWGIILAGPFIWMITILIMLFSAIYINAIHILKYFTHTNWSVYGLFGFFLAAVFIYIFIIIGGILCVPFAVFYSLLRIFTSAASSKTGPSMHVIQTPVTNLQSEKAEISINMNKGIVEDPKAIPYTHMEYLMDMIKTNVSVHILTLYYVYSIISQFTLQFANIFIAVLVVLYIIYRATIDFISVKRLNEMGWITHTEPIKVNFMNAISAISKISNTVIPQAVPVMASVVYPSSTNVSTAQPSSTQPSFPQTSFNQTSFSPNNISKNQNPINNMVESTPIKETVTQQVANTLLNDDGRSITDKIKDIGTTHSNRAYNTAKTHLTNTIGEKANKLLDTLPQEQQTKIRELINNVKTGKNTSDNLKQLASQGTDYAINKAANKLREKTNSAFSKLPQKHQELVSGITKTLLEEPKKTGDGL